MKKASPVRLSLRKLLIAMLAVGPVAILPSPLMAALPTSLTANRSAVSTPTDLRPVIQINGTGTLIASGGTTATLSVSDKSILVWSPGSFNIATGETYSFEVSNGSVLNKVGYNAATGAAGNKDTATINGSLTSSGKVFILANGDISVGNGARIETTGGLFLSTLGETNVDGTFTSSGNLGFSGSSQGNISIGGQMTGAARVDRGSLSAYSGNITVSNLTVTGDLVLNQAASASGAALAISGGSGPTIVSGNLTAVTNNGNVVQNGSVTVSGNSTFTTGTGNISLDSVVNSNPAVFGTIAVQGSGYTAVPTLTFSGGGGAGAAATAVLGLTAITFSPAGTGYTAAPTVSISGGGGNGASAIAAVNTSTGVVTGVTITNPGTGYTSSPSITFSPPTTGTAAPAATTGTLGLVGLAISSLGSGYTSAPSVTLSSAGASTVAAITAYGPAVNDFVGPITMTSNNVWLSDSTAVSLAASTLTGSLNVRAGGSITTTGAVATAGSVDLTTTGSGGNGEIVYANGSSVGGTFSARTNGGNVTVTTVGNLNTGNIFTGGASSITVLVTNGGTGYTSAPAVTFSSDAGGTGASGTATIVNGTVTSVTVVSSGAGYTSVPTITFIGGGSVPQTAATATAIISRPINPTATLVSGGAGYPVAPTVTFSAPPSGGTSPTATATVSDGVVTSITILTQGSGYSSVPTVTFSAPNTGTTRPTATVSLVPGPLSSIIIANTASQSGSGYTSGPTVTITGGGGSGAIATTTSTAGGTVATPFTLTAAGGGFTSAPTVGLTGGGTRPVTVANATNTLATISSSNVNLTTVGTANITGVISPVNNVTVSAASVTAGAAGAIGNSTGAANVVTITATAGNANLPAVTANSLVVTATGGNISQVGAITLGTDSVNGAATFNAGTGNITLDSANVMTNLTTALTGNNVSLRNGGAVTISNATVGGGLTINTTTAPWGEGDVTLGSGGGTTRSNITVGGNLTISTNNSDIQDDPAANLNIFGTVNLTTPFTGAGGNNTLYSISVANGGTGYSSAPSVTISGGGGSGALASATINTNGQVTGVTILSPGSGFTGAAAITFGGGLEAIGFSATANTANATTNRGPGGNVSITAATAEQGGSGRFGQLNISARTVNVQETTSLNLGNVTTTQALTARAGSGDVFITGTVSPTGALSVRASGAISEVGSGVVLAGGASTWNSSNSFGTNLSNSLNTFSGLVTVVNGLTNNIVSGSNINFTPGNVTAANSSLTITTVNAATGQVTMNGTNNFNSLDVRINAAGPINIAGTNTDRPLVRNLTLNTTDTSANSIRQDSALTANGTVLITTLGGVLLNNVSNNITGNVILSNVAQDATVYSTRNLTISGNVVGALTAIAGTSNDAQTNTFSSPWNLILGNLNVGSLNAAAMNGGTRLPIIPGSVNTLALSNVGSGYTSAPSVTLVGGGGSGATATVSGMGIGLLPVVSGGTGYTTVPTVAFTPATFGAAATAIVINGSVSWIHVTNAGSGYTTPPTISLTAAGSTTPAVITAPTLRPLGLTVINGGTGYTSAPTLTIAGGGGTNTIINPTAAGTNLTVTGIAGSIFSAATQGGNAGEGSSGTINQTNTGRLFSQNTAKFVTFNNNIVMDNDRNSNSRVEFSTGGGSGLAGSGDVTYVEDSTVRLGRIDTSSNATITSQFGQIIEDSTANGGTVINVGGVLTLNAPLGVVLGNATGSTSGNVTSVGINTTATAAFATAGNLTLGSIAANSLTVTANSIAQSGPLNIFGASTFNANNTITLTQEANNFGPVTLNVTNSNQNVAITESATLNLRSVNIAAGNGTFTAHSVNGDIIDSGFAGIRLGGNATSSGSGIVTLNASNGNIRLDDSTTDIKTFSGVVFNANDVTLMVRGGELSTPSTIVLGAAGQTSTARANLTVSSAIGSIGSAGRVTTPGTAWFQATNPSLGGGTINITDGGFGLLRFNGQTVSIVESGSVDIVTGSSSAGPASITSTGGGIGITNTGGSPVFFGSTVNLTASGGGSTGIIILPKLVNSLGLMRLEHTGTANLSALSINADLGGIAPVSANPSLYIPPQP